MRRKIKNIDKKIDAWARRDPEFKQEIKRYLAMPPEKRIVFDFTYPYSPFCELGEKLKTKKDCEEFVDDWIEGANEPMDKSALIKKRGELVKALWKEVKFLKNPDNRLMMDIIQEDIEILRGLE